MKNIDGQLLKEMLISGANNLYNHYPEIDALNVFPVPDGDTGMNMNLTLASGAKEIENRTDDDVFSISSCFSKGLLMGARGNSGVITSQIFRGFSQSLSGKKVINSHDLLEAFQNGKIVAYKAVMRPIEGTILTVIREAVDGLDKRLDSQNVLDAFQILVEEAKASLKRTPNLLPVLKEVGVVDSGGAGLVRILEGMYSALKGRFVERKTISTTTDNTAQERLENEEFGYCTEFILRIGGEDKKPFIESRFKTVLMNQGNSIVAVCDEDLVKVHIHTLHPGNVLTYAQTFGEFVKLKVENMTEQHTELISNTKSPEAEETENKKQVPSKKNGIVAVAAGNGIENTLLKLGVDEIVSGGQTMNPSIENIVDAIRKVNAETVFVFPNNSNIVMAALQAKDFLNDELNVIVVNTKTIPEGIAAISQYSPDLTAEDNLKNMNEAISHIVSGEITYAIKDTSINGVDVKKNDYMAIVNKDIVACDNKPEKVLRKMLKRTINADTYLVTIFVGEKVEESIKEELESELSTSYPNVEFDISRGNQPVYDFLVGIE